MWGDEREQWLPFPASPVSLRSRMIRPFAGVLCRLMGKGKVENQMSFCLSEATLLSNYSVNSVIILEWSDILQNT